MRIILNEDQKSWVTRNFYKIANAQEDAQKKRIIKRVADKVTQSKSSINFNKLEAKAVMQAAEVGVKTLGHALEAYKKDVKKYKEYIERAEAKTILLQGIVDKIKRNLK